MQNTIEICCGSVEDVINAQLGGADRVEFNSALYLGGLTPSLASLIYLKKKVSIPLICMVRTRGAGFCYSDEDKEVMCMDAELLLQHGADGLAFGALNADRSIDIEMTKKLVDITHKYHKEFVFHRAFDCVDNPIKSVETLIDLGVDRVLTSGFKTTALEGIEMLAHLQKTYGNKIEFLIGGKVNSTNSLQLIEQTQIHQIHSSCKTWVIDPSTHNDTVSYAYGNYDSHYECVDLELVKELVHKTKR
jgi:copper homeostasis protein